MIDQFDPKTRSMIGRSPYGKYGTWWSLKWKFRTDGIVQTSPVIGEDGTIYIGGHRNSIRKDMARSMF